MSLVYVPFVTVHYRSVGYNRWNGLVTFETCEMTIHGIHLVFPPLLPDHVPFDFLRFILFSPQMVEMECTGVLQAVWLPYYQPTLFFIHPPARRLMTSEFSPSSCRVSCSNIKYRTTVVRGSVQHSPWTAKRVDTALFFFHPISPVLRAVVHIKNRFNLSSPSSGTWNTSAAYEKETADVASNMQIRSSRNRQISSEREASESFEGMSYFPSSFLL